jgi:drug/metabolite transporter (DMT)-like permease
MPRVLAHLRSLDLRGSLIALLLAVIWGGNPVAIKVGLADAPPLRLAGMRFVLGGIAILVYAWWTRRAGLFSVRPGEARVMWSLGLLFACQVGLVNYGTDLTSAGHASVLVNSYAIHTVVLAHFFLPGDRLTWRTLAGVLVAYAGVVMLLAQGVALDQGTLLGDLVVSLGAFLLGERMVYTSRAVQKVDPVKLLLAQSVIGSTAFFLVSAWWEWAIPTRYTLSLAVALGYQGVLVAGFNFLVNAWLLQRYQASGLAIISLASPLCGVFMAAVVTGDALTPILLGAAVLVAGGVGIARPR